MSRSLNVRMYTFDYHWRKIQRVLNQSSFVLRSRGVSTCICELLAVDGDSGLYSLSLKTTLLSCVFFNTCSVMTNGSWMYSALMFPLCRAQRTSCAWKLCKVPRLQLLLCFSINRASPELLTFCIIANNLWFMFAFTANVDTLLQYRAPGGWYTVQR